MPHGVQPISAESDSPNPVCNRPPHTPAESQARSTKPKVTGSNPVGRIRARPLGSGPGAVGKRSATTETAPAVEPHDRRLLAPFVPVATLIRVSGLGRTIPALPVADISEAVECFEGRLGFTPVHVDVDSFAVMCRDDARIHLWKAGDRSWTERDDLSERPISSGAKSFLAGTASCRIEVTDVDALYAEHSGAGVLHLTSREGVRDTDFGSR